MLYQIGPLSLDTRPFSVEAVSRSGGGDFAAKPVMGALQPREFMGEGDEKLVLSGKLLPTKIGGLSELEMAFAMSKAGQSMPVVRGDGKSLGWFAIENVSEDHSELLRDGVGFVVTYKLNLVKVPPGSGGNAGGGGSTGIIGQILSLFEAL